MPKPLQTLAAPTAERRVLARHHYPCHQVPDTDPLVLLHGWGWDSGTWKPLLPALSQLGDVITLDLPGFGASPAVPELALEPLLQYLEDSLPPRATLIGWSLGGMLAVALAARCPGKVKRVLTLASNLSFVAHSGWPQAMPGPVNRAFNGAFDADPKATLRRFTGLLAQGDADERHLLKRLRSALDIPDTFNRNWHQSLELLAQLDNRDCFARLQQPGLHLFASADALVPMLAAGSLPPLNPRQRVEVIAGAGHALHWSQPALVAEQIERFVRATSGQLDKRRVAHSFSSAAASYDSVARLQREVSEHLLNMVPRLAANSRILDLGCGTGHIASALAERSGAGSVVGLDLAEGMLRFARRERPGAVDWLCADAEALPLADRSVDLIYSSLSIQWCEHLATLFGELHRALAPEGQLVFSTLGPETLRELKAAWQTVDGYVHVNRFQSREAIGAALEEAGFTDLEWHRENRVLRYRDLGELTRELKALGAHNVNRGQPAGLTGRRKILALKEAYERFRHEGLLPASYEVYYCRARPAGVPGQ